MRQQVGGIRGLRTAGLMPPDVQTLSSAMSLEVPPCPFSPGVTCAGS